MSSRSLNKVMLIGNLTRDPEIRYTSTGAAMCTFGLATNRSWKNAEGEVKEEAEFHNLVAWNKMAEICYQILAKGMKVYIEGELRTRSWEDDSGGTRYKTEIKVSEMILIDSRGKSGVGGGSSIGESKGGSNEITVEEVSGEKKVDSKKEDKEVKKEKPKKSAKPKESKKEEESSEDGSDILDDDLPF